MCGWAWLWWIVALTGMFPWARWALRRETDRLLTTLLTLALSFGSLTLIAFWIGWLGGKIDWRTVTALYVILCVSGWLVFWQTGRRTPIRPLSGILPDTLPGTPIGWLARLALLAIGVMAALIVFNALYWPIGTDDALAIYGWFGKVIATSGSLPHLYPGALYEAYPMALPLSEALIFQAAGWVDTHLAALVPAVLSIGTLGVAYLIGRTVVDRAVGITAALLIALTPSIAYWASTSYTDLPAGFFYGFAWLFAIRYHRDRQLREAILCGIMAGLAAWTKNSALLIVGTLGLWLIWLACTPKLSKQVAVSLHPNFSPTGARADVTRRSMRTILRTIIGDGLRIGLPFLAISGAWYARAEVQAGAIVPPTGWTFAAQRTFGNLFPYLIDQRYWPVGVLLTIGILWAISQAIRSRGQAFVPLTLLIATLPFFIIWWVLFSYENRFLLLLTPLIAVMGGLAVQSIGARLTRLPNSFRRGSMIASAAAILIALIPAGSAAVLFKNELIRQPLMNEAAKQDIRFGGRYDLGLYLQSQPAAACTLTSDTLMPYLAFPAPVTVDTHWLTPPIARDGCQSFMLKPAESLPAELSTAKLITAYGGYRLYSWP